MLAPFQVHPLLPSNGEGSAIAPAFLASSEETGAIKSYSDATTALLLRPFGLIIVHPHVLYIC